MKCNVIINPLSGKGKSLETWHDLAGLFDEAGWDIIIYTDLNDSTWLEDCDCIIAIGGDGTVHTVINNLMHSQRKIPLGIIPAGTGNALMMDINCTDPRAAAQAIIKGTSRYIDVLEITTSEQVYYSISVVGWGLFAAANRTAEKIRFTWKLRYNLAALWHLAFKRTYPATIKYQDKTETGRFITVFAANTKHTGRGMRAAPKARIDDGLMDLVIIRDENRINLIRLFKTFFDGSYITHKKVSYLQLTEFQLQTDNRTILNIDGEMKGQSPFSVRILPKALELLI